MSFTQKHPRQLTVYRNDDVGLLRPCHIAIPYSVDTLVELCQHICIALGTDRVLRFLYSLTGEPLWSVRSCLSAGAIVMSAKPGFRPRHEGVTTRQQLLPPPPPAPSSSTRSSSSLPLTTPHTRDRARVEQRRNDSSPHSTLRSQRSRHAVSTGSVTQENNEASSPSLAGPKNSTKHTLPPPTSPHSRVMATPHHRSTTTAASASARGEETGCSHSVALDGGSPVPATHTSSQITAMSIQRSALSIRASTPSMRQERRLDRIADPLYTGHMSAVHSHPYRVPPSITQRGESCVALRRSWQGNHRDWMERSDGEDDDVHTWEEEEDHSPIKALFPSESGVHGHVQHSTHVNLCAKCPDTGRVTRSRGSAHGQGPHASSSAARMEATSEQPPKKSTNSVRHVRAPMRQAARHTMQQLMRAGGSVTRAPSRLLYYYLGEVEEHNDEEEELNVCAADDVSSTRTVSETEEEQETAVRTAEGDAAGVCFRKDSLSHEHCAHSHRLNSPMCNRKNHDSSYTTDHARKSKGYEDETENGAYTATVHTSPYLSSLPPLPSFDAGTAALMRAADGDEQSEPARALALRLLLLRKWRAYAHLTHMSASEVMGEACARAAHRRARAQMRAGAGGVVRWRFRVCGPHGSGVSTTTALMAQQMLPEFNRGGLFYNCLLLPMDATQWVADARRSCGRREWGACCASHELCTRPNRARRRQTRTRTKQADAGDDEAEEDDNTMCGARVCTTAASVHTPHSPHMCTTRRDGHACDTPHTTHTDSNHAASMCAEEEKDGNNISLAALYLLILHTVFDAVAAQRPALRAHTARLVEMWSLLLVPMSHCCSSSFSYYSSSAATSASANSPPPCFAACAEVAAVVGHRVLAWWDGFVARVCPVLRGAVARPHNRARRDAALRVIVSLVPATIAATLQFAGVVVILDGLDSRKDAQAQCALLSHGHYSSSSCNVAAQAESTIAMEEGEEECISSSWSGDVKVVLETLWQCGRAARDDDSAVGYHILAAWPSHVPLTHSCLPLPIGQVNTVGLLSASVPNDEEEDEEDKDATSKSACGRCGGGQQQLPRHVVSFDKRYNVCEELCMGAPGYVAMLRGVVRQEWPSAAEDYDLRVDAAEVSAALAHLQSVAAMCAG